MQRLMASGGPLTVIDDDAGRRRITAALAARLARQVRLDLPIRILVNSEASILTSAHGAEALAHDHTVWINPTRYRPDHASGRYLLAHELIHIGQRKRTPGGDSDRLAESEAERLARDFANNGALSEPSRSVTPSRIVAAKDPNPSDSPVRDPHNAEFNRIQDLLSYRIFDWSISERDVSDALIILQDLSFISASDLIRRLDSKYRLRLIDHLKPMHYARFRHQILACYAALESKEILKSGGPKLILALNLENLEDDDQAALLHVLQSLPNADRAALRQSQIGNTLEALSQREVKWNEADARRKQEPDTRDDVTELFIEDPTLADTLAKLEKLLRGWVSGDDAAKAVDILGQYVDRPAQLRALAVRLDDTERLDKLIDHVPLSLLTKSTVNESSTATVPVRRVLAAALAARPPYKNSLKAEHLLTGVISEEDAYRAMLLVEALPKEARDSFLRAEDGGPAGELRSHLPEAVRRSATFNSYAGGEGNRDRAALLSQLSDEELWTVGRAAELDGVLRMALAAGERDFVRQQLRKVESRLESQKIKLPRDVESLVEKYDLRPATEAENKRGPGSKGKVEAIFSLLSQGEPGTLQAVSGPVIVLRNVDLSTVQDAIDGTLAGVEFLRGHPKSSGINLADISLDTISGVLNLSARHLELSSLNVPIGDSKVQAGRCTLHNVEVHLNYATAKTPRKAAMFATVGSAVLNDIVWITPESMLAINSIEIEALGIELGEDNARATSSIALPIFDATAGVLSDQITKTPFVEMSKAFSKPQKPIRMDVRFGSLKIRGLTTSGGQHIREIDIRDFQLGGGEAPDAYVTALQRSLKYIDDRIKAEQEREKTAANPISQEITIARLLSQRAAIVEALKDSQRGGVVMDVGSISVSGMRGNIDLDHFSLSHIHGQGSSPTSLLALITDKEKLRTTARMLQGERAGLLRELDYGNASFQLYFSAGELSNLQIHAAVPTEKELREQLQSVQKELINYPGSSTLLRLRDQIVADLPFVQEYDRLAAIGLTYLDAGGRSRLLEIRNRFRDPERDALRLEALTITGGKLDLGPRSPQLTLTADAFSATGVKTKGFGVDYVAARKDVKITAGRALSPSGVATVDLQHLGIQAEELTLQGAQFGEYSVGHVAVDRGAIALDLSKNETTISIASEKITVEGINLDAVMAFMGQKEEALEEIRKTRDLTANEKRALEQIRGARTIYQNLKQAIENARELLVRFANTPEEAAARATLGNAVSRMQVWEKDLKANRLTVNGVNIRFTASGNVLLGTMEPKKSFSVSSQDESGQLISGATLEGAEGPGGEWKTIASLGPIIGSASREGNLLTSNLVFKSLAANGLRIQTDSGLVWSKGATSINDLVVDVRVFFVDQTWRPQKIEINWFHVGRIQAGHVGFRQDDIEVEVESGALVGVDASRYILDLEHGFSLESQTDTDGKLRGQARIDAFNLRLRAGIGNIFARGTIYGKGIKVSAIDKNKNLIKVGDLGLGGLDVAMPGVHVRLTAKNIHGSIIQEKNRIVLAFKMGDISVEKLDLRAGFKKIKSNGPVILKGATIGGSFGFALDPFHVTKFHINKLHIPKITAEDLSYEDETYKAELTAAGGKHLVELVDIDLNGLQWAPHLGITAGSLDVTRLALNAGANVAIRDDLGKELAKVAGSVALTGIGLNVKFDAGGKVIASLVDLDSYIKGSYTAATGDSFAINLHLKSTLPTFDAADKTLSLPLHIDQIRVSSLSITSPAMVARIPEGAGGIRVSDIDPDVTVHFRRDAKPGESAIEKVTVDSFRIDSISARGFELQFPQRKVTIRATPDKAATIYNVEVKPSAIGGEFTLAPGADKSWHAEGIIKAEKADTDPLTVEVANLIERASVSFTASKFTAEFFNDGTNDIDLETLQADANLGLPVGPGQAAINVQGGITIEGFKKSREGRLRVKSIAGKHLVFDSQGFHLEVEELKLPDEREIPQSGDWFIPNATLRNAKFQWRPTQPEEKGTATPDQGSSAAKRAILDQLSGYIRGKVKKSVAEPEIVFEIKNGWIHRQSGNIYLGLHNEIISKMKTQPQLEIYAIVGGGIVQDLKRGDLNDREEIDRLRENQEAKLLRLLETRDVDPADATKEELKPHEDRTRLVDLTVHLTMPKGAKIPFAGGSLTLSELSADPKPGAMIDVKLERLVDDLRHFLFYTHLELGIEQLTFGAYSLSAARVVTHQMKGTLSMKGIDPQGASGEIGDAEVTNIKFHMEDLPKPKQP